MFGQGRRIFAGKRRLHEEPFCPFVTSESGYHELFRDRGNQPHNPLGNTGSFGPVQDIGKRYDNQRRWKR